MDLAREDMERVETKGGDEVDRVKWRIFSRCGRKPKEEKKKA